MSFDPNATPVTDRIAKWEITSAATMSAVFAVECAEMEKRATLAEEKLRIAVEGLKNIASVDRKPIIVQFEAASLLSKIEEVG